MRSFRVRSLITLALGAVTVAVYYGLAALELAGLGQDIGPNIGQGFIPLVGFILVATGAIMATNDWGRG